MRRIYMIDCPGVVYPQGDSETQIILKGVGGEPDVRSVAKTVLNDFQRGSLQPPLNETMEDEKPTESEDDRSTVRGDQVGY
uniref:G domain-containing protein n=1 Tax=Parascaris equorum TaxID=6256 RepID=A0A914S339_PAREQ